LFGLVAKVMKVFEWKKLFNGLGHPPFRTYLIVFQKEYVIFAEKSLCPF
jgi:hypothetical protein